VLALKRAGLYSNLLHTSITWVHFFLELVFFWALDFGVVRGLGALGFFVGTLATFFAFDGDFLALAGDAFLFFSAIFFTEVFLVSFVFAFTDCFLSFGTAGRPPLRTPELDTATFSGFPAASLNDPDVYNNQPISVFYTKVHHCVTIAWEGARCC
jgi:hypothetical protein